MSFRSASGPHFNDPRLLQPVTVAASAFSMYDKGNSDQTGNAVAFFTAVSQYGVIDSTNWAINTYKTIYSHTGMGLVAEIIGPTAGGAETTTFEITIDGILRTLTVGNAAGERAVLLAAGWSTATETDFTTASKFFETSDGGLDSGTLSTMQTGSTADMTLPSMRGFGLMGIPLLQYNVSCQIRMSHSANITNVTATAYSGVVVRKGIAA